MDDVIVFAEQEPGRFQFLQVLQHLEEFRGAEVATYVHLRPARVPRGTDEAGRWRRMPGQAPAGEARDQGSTEAPGERSERHDVELAEARQRLSHVVAVLRAAGHEVHGSLLTGPMPRTLLRMVRERQPQAILLVTDRHRLAHWTHHDLERRLRHLTGAPVTAIVDSRSSTLV